VSIPVIASINCVTAEQWTYFPKRIEQAGADALELNIFILPTDLSRTGEQNENLYFDIIREVKKQISIPVAVKISYYFSNLASMIKKISETGIDGMVLFNKFYNPDFDLDDFVVTSTNVLSSPTDISNSLRWMAIMSQRVDCDLAASTGIHDGDGVIKQILAGANTVQIVSTVYKNGPEQIKKILAQMNNWMDLKRFSSLNDFRGKMSQSKSKDPAAYERVQFMKYFRGYKPE
jgi:dihydroorotate dehydrogenase (fumarate)